MRETTVHVCSIRDPSISIVPRILKPFFSGSLPTDNLVPRRDSGELEFYYRRISAVKQCKALRGSQSKT